MEDDRVSRFWAAFVAATGRDGDHTACAFGKDPALIREGGSIPIVSQFRSILGVETLLLGLALPDCRAHSPNENFPLENMDAGIRLNKAVLAELAKK